MTVQEVSSPSLISPDQEAVAVSRLLSQLGFAIRAGSPSVSVEKRDGRFYLRFGELAEVQVRVDDVALNSLMSRADAYEVFNHQWMR